MRKAQIIGIPLLIVVFVLGACAPKTPTPTTTPTPALPKSGEWTALTEFGELSFTVNPDSTGIAKISLHFPGEFKCGGIQVSGGIVSVENPNLWPITDGQFTVDTSLSLGKVVIDGKFDETGTHASGTWEINVCSGTWESSPGS